MAALLIALLGVRIVPGKQYRQGEEMEGKLVRSIFWALVGIFVVIVGVFAVPAARELLMGFLFIIISGRAFLLHHGDCGMPVRVFSGGGG